MVSLQYELSHKQQGVQYEKTPCPTHHIFKISLQYELSDEQQDVQYE